MQNVQSVTYAYDTVLELVDYCGDVRRNKASSSNPTYHRNYSPNNIKCLIFSPDGAFVLYHVPVDGKRYKHVSLAPAYVSAIQVRDGYKPITAVLYADRICASIEEVIVCSQSSKSGITLSSAELDFYGLISNYENVKTDLHDTIKSRYKRLYSFSVYNGTIQELLSVVKTKDINEIGFLITKQEEIIPRLSMEIFHKEDWYKGYGSVSGTYVMDAKDGELYNYFQNVIAVLDGRARDAKLDAFTEQQIKKYKISFERAYEKYFAIYTALDKLEFMQNENTVALITNFTISSNDKHRAKICDNYYVTKSMLKVLDTYVSDKISSGEAVKSGTESLEHEAAIMYKTLCTRVLYNGLTKLPIDVVEAIKLQFSFNFIVPDDLKSDFEELGIYTESKGNFISSVACLSSLACILFISPTIGKPLNKYYKSETWKEMITNA